MKRPARKTIPLRVKREVLARQGGRCSCGCNQAVGLTRKRDDTDWDHSPALWSREVDEAGTDYIPAQNDPRYINARRTGCHREKTSGRAATSAGSDVNGYWKNRRLRGELKGRPKRRWPSREIPSRPFARK